MRRVPVIATGMKKAVVRGREWGAEWGGGDEGRPRLLGIGEGPAAVGEGRREGIESMMVGETPMGRGTQEVQRRRGVLRGGLEKGKKERKKNMFFPAHGGCGENLQMCE